MLESLLIAIQAEAKRASFPLDSEVYTAVGKDPTYPILFAGNLKAEICFFGRDLGKDEVLAGQPLYGASGTLVRQGFYKGIHGKVAPNKQELASVCERILLTNTVPYKPPGNKAYTQEVKERFRPFIERLLVLNWQGKQIITLGTEAFKWYSPYGSKGEVKSFFERGDRYQSQLTVTLVASDEQGLQHQRRVTLLPLPHPSPLNQKYYAQFPQLLQQRLDQCEF
ncbi:uracil-DNA glycosylase family protein [Gloeocapsa sp. PCC 73106]|uniref:uracil-DNA glycosylase family protein n=1 Tax=Gloeocapsa sp. PCC 73106 TaxID=102232 RepID=UPI0002ABC406|nr:uracil-DNA glycosylase family protein [Gloeocapsa sp. PCC 73106]ELR99697.1 uracil-DNA glycosylase [Gloeocapsa sp. PCC 73106]